MPLQPVTGGSGSNARDKVKIDQTKPALSAWQRDNNLADSTLPRRMDPKPAGDRAQAADSQTGAAPELHNSF